MKPPIKGNRGGKDSSHTVGSKIKIKIIKSKELAMIGITAAKRGQEGFLDAAKTQAK